MKLIFVCTFSLLSVLAKGQIYVSKSFNDSLYNVEQEYVGKSFPRFKAKDIDGKKYSDSAFKGKITLVNFWFESCHPCVAEFEPLNEIFEKFQDNKSFRFITFTFESSSSINMLIKKYSLKFPVIPISKENCYRLNFNSGFPTNMIIDKNGNVVFFKSGGATEVANASQDIDSTILPKLIELLDKN